jgi:CheY-like chemotaxis protein
MTQRGTLRASALLFLMFGFGASAYAQDAKELIKEAYELTSRGKAAEALEKINAVLATDPSAEDAYDLRQQLEGSQWIEMAVASDKLGEAVRILFGRAMPAEAAKTGDVAAIDKLLDEARAGDWAARERALRALALNHGEYAVSRLWRDLGNSETDRRVQAMDWMRRLGAEASLPLMQCLKAPEAMIRANAAITLGMIGDPRAKPYLAIAANDGEPIVKDAAMQALAKMGGSGSPIEEGVALAARYLARDPAVVNTYRVVYPAWAMERDGDAANLVAYETPRDLYHLKTAEGLLFDVLRTDPAHVEGRTLLVAVLLAESEYGRGLDTSDEAMAAVAKACFHARVLAAAQGPAILTNAVRWALASGRYDVATAAVGVLATTADADADDALAGLTAALEASNKNVRHAAAIALAKIRPRGVDGARLVAALAEAVGEDAVRNVLVIDDVAETRDLLCAQLEARNWFCAWSDSGAAGVVRLRDYPIEDAVIVRYDLGRGHVSNVISSIRRDDRTKDVPVFVLASEAHMDAAKRDWDGKVQGFIATPPNAASYEPAVRDAAKIEDAAREAATKTAAAAAEALASFDPKGGMPVASATGALVSSLKGDDRVRVPAMVALGRIGDASAEAGMIAVLRDTTASEAARGGAAMALARIARATGAMNADFGAALRDAATAGGSPEYLSMLSQAVGLLNVAPQTRLGVMRFGRAGAAVDLVK